MRSAWRDGDRVRTVEIEPLAGGRSRVTVDGVPLELAVETLADGRLRLAGPDGVTVAEVTAEGSRRFVRLGRLDFVLEREAAGRRGRSAPHAHDLEAPMPGLVTRVLVAVGDTVRKGQPLVAIEAMKMEHLVRAPRDGRVEAVTARVGEMVEGGVAVVELDGEG